MRGPVNRANFFLWLSVWNLNINVHTHFQKSPTLWWIYGSNADVHTWPSRNSTVNCLIFANRSWRHAEQYFFSYCSILNGGGGGKCPSWVQRMPLLPPMFPACIPVASYIIMPDTWTAGWPSQSPSRFPGSSQEYYRAGRDAVNALHGVQPFQSPLGPMTVLLV